MGQSTDVGAKVSAIGEGLERRWFAEAVLTPRIGVDKEERACMKCGQTFSSPKISTE